MNVVLDASAMIAFLRDEAGSEIVMNQIRPPENHVFAHALNLCEVYYDFSRATEKRRHTMPSMICLPWPAASLALPPRGGV
jgi:PIN domain nuclease of toxin-antitoxin system